MMKPTIHMNGTAKADLMQGYMTAYNALDAAKTKLQEAAPHGRDYYVQGDTAYLQARKEHDARLTKVQDVMTELYTIMEEIL